MVVLAASIVGKSGKVLVSRQFVDNVAQICVLKVYCIHILVVIALPSSISVGGNFNFMKFLSHTYDQDFEKIVQIRSWIWIFSILFIFFSAHEFYNHYWLPFIPLVVAIIGGTKLQVVITNMCMDSVKEKAIIKGTILVKPNDDYFWFGRPEWLLYLIQFILLDF
ncbi:MLO-like protein [Arachis ipaensis]|uniref:MLO-like protein n=1 Tax=Arachis ipaensis TaxID=130454 RepID=UPI000A2B1348|nr:MLO-like protein [Arachis ipaensis]